MLYPVLNGRYVHIGTEVLRKGTDVDVLMDHDGVVQSCLQGVEPTPLLLPSMEETSQERR